MSRAPLIITDPDLQSRKVLIARCKAYDLSTLEASSLREARNLLKSNEISEILIASQLTELFEFTPFLRDCPREKIYVFGVLSCKKTNLPYLGENTAEVVEKLLYLKQPRTTASSSEAKASPSESEGPKLILIGASTGGISALEAILRDFPKDCPPTLIVQHMREGFAENMVARFDQLLLPRVHAATGMQEISLGSVYIAANTHHHIGVAWQQGKLFLQLIKKDPVCGHRPSVDVLFTSAAPLVSKMKIAAALLTGMGDDGAEGLYLLSKAGAFTIAQDERSSVIWGMPRAAIDKGAGCAVLPLSQIGRSLLACHPADAFERQSP